MHFDGVFFSVFSDFYIILFDFFFPHWLNTRWKERDTTSVSSSWRGKSYFCSSGHSAGLSVPVITAEATEAAGGASLPLEWRAPSGNSGGAFPVPAAPSPGKWAEGGEPGPARPRRREIPGNHRAPWSPVDKPSSGIHSPPHSNPCFEERPALSRGDQALVGKWLLKATAT